MVKHPWPLPEISLSDFRGLATLNINTYLPTYLPTSGSLISRNMMFSFLSYPFALAINFLIRGFKIGFNIRYLHSLLAFLTQVVDRIWPWFMCRLIWHNSFRLDSSKVVPF